MAGKLKKAWSGRLRVLGSKGKERAETSSLFGKQEREAGTARELESTRGSLWSVFATTACLFTGLGPACLPIGQAVGKIAKGVGQWKKKDIEDFKIDVDLGKWDKTQDKEDIEEANRRLEQYDTAEFWTSVKEFGTSLFSAYRLGGGIGKEGLTPENWSPTHWGGKSGKTTGQIVNTLLGTDSQAPLDYSNYQFGEGSDWNLGYVGEPPPSDIISDNLGRAPVDTSAWGQVGGSRGGGDWGEVGDVDYTATNLWEYLEPDPWTGYKADWEPGGGGYFPSYYKPE